MTTRLEKSVLLPLSPEDDEALTRLLGRAIQQGYTITESEETTNGWTWRTFVFERLEGDPFPGTGLGLHWAR